MGILVGKLVLGESDTDGAPPHLHRPDQKPWLNVMGRFESLLKVGWVHSMFDRPQRKSNTALF